MSITNTAKPGAASLTNTSKPSFAELWSTITTTWASETRTWVETSSLLDNTSKPRSLGSYTFDEIGTRTIAETGGTFDDSTFMVNTAKPS